ncbi:MAG: hypothetical protein V4628_13350 [Pseudomonadota bacterium]
MFHSPFIVPVAFAFAWVCVTWIRAAYGIKGPFAEGGWHKQRNMNVPPMFQKMMEKAMEDRDREVQDLKDRIAVLEKIVTDNHKSDSLAEEIERLRDRK